MVSIHAVAFEAEPSNISGLPRCFSVGRGAVVVEDMVFGGGRRGLGSRGGGGE